LFSPRRTASSRYGRASREFLQGRVSGEKALGGLSLRNDLAQVWWQSTPKGGGGGLSKKITGRKEKISNILRDL